jgi:hypothetical protein
MPARNLRLKPEDELVGEKVAAEIIGIFNYKTLSNWRSDGRNLDLPYIRIGRSIRYRIGDLIEFRQRHTVGGVKAVEPVIEQVAHATSTRAKAPAPHPMHTAAASESPLTTVALMQPLAAMSQPAAVRVIRPSDLLRKQTNI